MEQVWVGLITRPEKSTWCGVSECNRKASIMRRALAHWGLLSWRKNSNKQPCTDCATQIKYWRALLILFLEWVSQWTSYGNTCKCLRIAFCSSGLHNESREFQRAWISIRIFPMLSMGILLKEKITKKKLETKESGTNSHQMCIYKRDYSLLQNAQTDSEANSAYNSVDTAGYGQPFPP